MIFGNSLTIVNATKYYKKFKAVNNVNLTVNHGEFLTILGPSGSGKTSLLKLIAGFEELSNGSIFLNNQDISKKKAFEREVGMVFQNYALFPHMTVFDNIAYPLRLRKVSKLDISERVENILKLVQLEQLESRYPKQLSGGQQQRVALARAIVFNPPLLLLDEPLGALDKNLRQQMQLEIKHIQEKVGITTISVTHDQEEALTMSDRICVMNHGQIEQVDTPENIYKRPINRFVANFIGEINLIQGDLISVDANVAKVKIFGKSIIHIEIDDTNYPYGKTVYVALRPENIQIAKVESEFQHTTKVKVVETTYVGEAVKVKAKTCTELDQIITLKVPGIISDSMFCGQDILIGWNDKDTTIISEDMS